MWTCSSAAAASADMSCEKAAAIVERSLDIPQGLLAAISRIESNNYPLAVNVNGLGVRFSRPEFAADAVQTMIHSGVMGARPKVDVGCFQINLGWHPEAFSSVEQSFDPLSNGLAAGLFLRKLHAETGDWQRAVARYHAASKEGDHYAASVFRKVEEGMGLLSSGDGQKSFANHEDWIKTVSAYGITVFEPRDRQ